jgi:uncharacterized protein YggE
MRVQGGISMKRIIFAIALVFGMLDVQAQSITGSPFLAVHGKANTEVVPDIFPLSITLRETSMDGAAAQGLIEGYAEQIVALTQTMKMADRDVQVSNLSTSPEYRYDDGDDKQIFLGNTYERKIALRFRALADLRKAIDALPKAKQVQLDTEAFESSKADDIRRELLSKSVEDARKTAEVMAAAVGKRVGPVHNVSNQGFNVRYVETSGSTELDSIQVTGNRVASAPPVVLREGTISLDQHVYIIYMLVD